MTITPPCYSWQNGNLLLQIRVHPRAAKNQLGQQHDGRLKISLTTAPVDGKANAHLIKLLADYFGIAKSKVKLLHGETSRLKSVLIIDPQQNFADFPSSPIPGKRA